MNKELTPISSSLFTYVKSVEHPRSDWPTAPLFVADVSDLHANGFETDPYGSFLMKSAKTGAVVKFLFVDMLVSNADYEVDGWLYKASGRDIAKNPALADVRVHILND